MGKYSSGRGGRAAFKAKQVARVQASVARYGAASVHARGTIAREAGITPTPTPAKTYVYKGKTYTSEADVKAALYQETIKGLPPEIRARVPSQVTVVAGIGYTTPEATKAAIKAEIIKKLPPAIKAKYITAKKARVPERVLERKIPVRTGRVTAAPLITGTYEKYKTALESKGLEFEKKKDIPREGIVPRPAYMVGAMGVGAVKGVVGVGEAVVHPIETVKGLYHMARHPKETAIGIYREVKEKPAMSVGEVIGMGVGGKILGVGGKYARRGTAGVEARARALVQFKKYGPEFKAQMAAVEEIGFAKPTVKKIKVSDVERLKGKAAGVTEKWLVKEKGRTVVGGSVAQRSQTKVKWPTKPSDVDLYAKNPSARMKDLSSKMKKGGVKDVKLEVTGEGTINEKAAIYVKGEKAIETHTRSWLRQNIASVTPAYTLTRAYIRKSPRGVGVLDIRVQARRKLAGAFEQPRRAYKDIPHFRRISGELFKTAKKEVEKGIFPGYRAYKLEKAKAFYYPGYVQKPIGLGFPMLGKKARVSLTPFAEPTLFEHKALVKPRIKKPKVFKEPEYPKVRGVGEDPYYPYRKVKPVSYYGYPTRRAPSVSYPPIKPKPKEMYPQVKPPKEKYRPIKKPRRGAYPARRPRREPYLGIPYPQKKVPAKKPIIPYPFVKPAKEVPAPTTKTMIAKYKKERKERRRKEKVTPYPQPKKYTPTLKALVGLEKGIAPTKKKFLTGFEPRPIPNGVRRIAKKAKKRKR